MNEKRLLLIYPPFFRLFADEFSYAGFPLALGYLSGTVRAKTSWNVTVYNADFNPHSRAEDVAVTFSFRTGSGHDRFARIMADDTAPIWREIAGRIEELKPDVVGISAMSQNYRCAVHIARIAKAVNSATVTIVGGPHPTMVGGEVLEDSAIDIGVRGEGETTIVELLECIEKNTSLRGVKGIVYRDGSSIVDTGTRELIPDLDTLCFPHDSAPDVLVDYDRYPKSAFHSILASRGCPFMCTFCGSRSIWGRHVRYRSPKNIAEELSRLQARGLMSVRFADDTFGLDREWTAELCREMKASCPGLKWKCEMHVRLVTDELLAMMKDAGCHLVEIGIESGDDRVLGEIHKGITTEKALEACDRVKSHGMELQAYFMAGFPQDTEESLQNTMKAIRRVKGYICFSIFCPFPGSPLYDLCREKGLLSDSFDPCMHNYQSLEGFSQTIPQARFRLLASSMIREVDRKNAMNRFQRVFTHNTLWRVKELGLWGALKKAVMVVLKRFSPTT